MTDAQALADGLLPCPFCGGEAASYEGKHCSSVKCDNVHAIHVYQPSLAEAIAAWNQRTPPPSQSEQADDVALLREARDQLKRCNPKVWTGSAYGAHHALLARIDARLASTQGEGE